MSQPPFDPNLVLSPQSLDLSAMKNMPANLPLLLQLLLAGQDQLQQKRLQRLAETIASVTAPEQRIAFIQQQLAQQMALLQKN